MADKTALSLAQKAALSSGANFWFTKAVANIPAIMLTEAPTGYASSSATPTTWVWVKASRRRASHPPRSWRRAGM